MRAVRVAAAAASVLLLAACGAPSQGSDSGGGGSVSGGGSSSSGGAAGGSVGAPSAVPSAAAGAYPHDGGDRTDSAPDYTDGVAGCTVFFGVSKDSSGEYFVSADREGIGAQVSWSCADVAGVDRFDLHAKLQYALISSGPWTDDDHPRAKVDIFGTTKRSGAVFPFNAGCTTDWWRVVFTWNGTLAGGESFNRYEITSQPRKVTDEDCARA